MDVKEKLITRTAVLFYFCTNCPNKCNAILFCLIKNLISFLFPGCWLLVSSVVVGNLSSLYTAQGSLFRCKNLSVINGSPEQNNVLKLWYTYVFTLILIALQIETYVQIKNLEVNKYEIPSRQFVKKSAPMVIERSFCDLSPHSRRM